ncbi:hypothetical protein K4L44_05810 [Halosquirtibacter laminarini]|uniref:Uncharacterized protein n=1 Tax=Halosquirtibacter laminarini TaxID=3374600 RepID=A0AC61NNZ3_9BACT|nr:hypothetical protein K4L44_05810 [Prolixibacteraceae bacterium]
MKKNVQEIKIKDLAGNDVRQAIIKENALAPDFIEKHLGNYIYSQGSDKVYELGRLIYQGESVEVNEEQKEEFKKLVKSAFEGFPPIVARSIIQSLN